MADKKNSTNMNKKSDKRLSNKPITKTFDLYARFDTIQKTIDDYMSEITRHNRYKTYSGLYSDFLIDDRSRLIDLYEMAYEQDAHLRSVIENLESQVLGDRYSLGTFGENNEFIIDSDETKKIEGIFFENIVKGIMEARLYGYTLLEILPEINPITNKINRASVVERRNVLPNQNLVLTRAGDPTSEKIDITQGWYKDRYVMVNTDNLGLFATTTPAVLAKKMAFGSYVNFTHTYGMPIIHGRTPNAEYSQKQELANAIARAMNDRIVVTGTEDVLDVKPMSQSNSERIYIGLLDKVDSYISNVIVGSQSMAGATQSYVGSTKAHQDIFRDRIAVYRKFIENVINEEVLPRLVKFGYIKDGVTFRYSKRLEMSIDEKLNFIATVLPTYDIPEDVFLSEFGITVNKRDIEGGNTGIKSIDNGDGVPTRTMSDDEYYKRFGEHRDSSAKKVVMNYMSKFNKKK